jgi:glycerol kinase
VLDLPVERPGFVETTALGAAMLAGIGCGMFSSPEEAATMRGAVETFEPGMAQEVRDDRLGRWRDALRGVVD